MPRKKLDNRLKVLIENGVELKHRTMFVIVGDKGKDQVVILHHMLSKAAVKARPSVLWCYKKELGFSSNRKKRMKQLQKKITTGSLDVNEDDPFELFVTATNIRYCYYAETHKILGNTFGMCVLQDFEAITPNLLARTIETVEGGGIIVILLQSVNSLKQLYTMSMDVHARYRTEAHQEVVGRFNERFILSLVSCKRCIVIDDSLNILPLSSHCLSVQPVPRKTKEESLTADEKELAELKASLQDTQPVGVLANCCRTLDQARALLKFIESISEKTLRSTVALTAARGRGKSAALGLAIAAAVAFNYSNIFVTSPSPENLNTLFEFVLKGFDVLEYTEHMDYELIQSTNPEFNKAVIRLNIFREHRQTIQYIHPSDAHKLGQAELLVIDEAAAIPLPLVRNLLGPYLVFMSSTINGYEGTGRSLSLKLIQQLRNQTVALGGAKNSHIPSKNQKETENKVSSAGRVLHEVQLNESIRYRQGDDVENWLNELLCLDAAILPHLSAGCPLPQNCDLYYINRDTLFCYHKASEIFLQRLMALYVASHYKNSPNDLQMLSDAPAHHLLCLLGPVDSTTSSLPEVLCVIQVCMEGAISQESVSQSLSRGKRASGDLIPWTVARQFQDEDFPALCGARVVRIATHPDYQKMGYGSRALELLQQYYEGHIMNIEEENVLQEIEPITEESVGLLEEEIRPRKSLPPLLLKLSERKPELLDYLGVSFGVTNDLLRFWKRAGFVPVYMRQTASDLTGEHSCIMLKALNVDDTSRDSTWLSGYWIDFRKRFVCLLGFQFRSYQPSFALSILQNKNLESDNTKLDKVELQHNFSNYDLKRLELYAKNMADYHIITDLLPAISKLYFMAKLDLSLSLLQSALLLGMGLQYKTVDEVSKELDLPASQLLGLFNRAIRKISQYLREILETAVAKTLIPQKPIVMEAAKQSVDDDLREGAKAVRSKLKRERENLEDSPVEESSEPAIELGFMKNVDLAQYKIKGAEAEWQKALKGGSTAVVSVKGKNRKRNRDKTAKSFAIGATKSMKERKKKRK